eukprot:CFRG4707T1
MLTKVIAATAAAAGAHALQACVWLGDNSCTPGESLICKDMPDGQCVQVFSVAGTDLSAKITDQRGGEAMVGVYLNSNDCSSGGITDTTLESEGYMYSTSPCKVAASFAGQTAYIQTTGDFGDTAAPPVPPTTPDTAAPDTATGTGAVNLGAISNIQSVLSLLSTSGLPANFIDAFQTVIEANDGGDEFIAELADVDIPGLLSAFGSLPSLDSAASAIGSGGLPAVPEWIATFAQQLKANIRQPYTQNMLDALSASTITTVLTNCRGYFAIYGASSALGSAVAGTSFGSQVEGLLGVNPEGISCDGHGEIIDFLPCTTGFLNTGVATCSVDVCCAPKMAQARVPIVAQIIAEIITRVLIDLITPIIESALPYIEGGVVSLENAENGELDILTNCGTIFYYRETLGLTDLKCKHKKDLDKFQPCATKPHLISYPPWGVCSPHECCGHGTEQSGIGRAITSFIAYEEAKFLELLTQQLTIVLGASLKTNTASGKYLITCKQWKNFLGGKCPKGQEHVDTNMFCSTYSCMSFGVHKCSTSICCGHASEGWIESVLDVAIASGQIYEFATIAANANPFTPQWIMGCPLYQQMFGLQCPGGRKADPNMPCTLQTYEDKSSFYKCTEHNCCGNYGKRYQPESVFQEAIEEADATAHVLRAINLSNVRGLFRLDYSKTQFAVNCETWAAIPGWGYKPAPGCKPTNSIPWDVSCPNIATKHPHFQPLAPCRSLVADMEHPPNNLDDQIPPCHLACYNRGEQKHTTSGAILAAQSSAYAVQLVYLLTHMIADPVRAQAIAELLVTFADSIGGGTSASLDQTNLLALLGPILPDEISAILNGNPTENISGDGVIIAKIQALAPLLPQDGLLMNCGTWAADLDINYFGRGTCPTGRPVDHDLPCWVSAINGANGAQYAVNIQPNVGDCSPQYCCACRTKAAYSTANVRLLGSAGAAVSSLLFRKVITPIMFLIGRSLGPVLREFGVPESVIDMSLTRIGFGDDQIYMPFMGYGGTGVIQVGDIGPYYIGKFILGNMLCIATSRYPDGSTPKYEDPAPYNVYNQGKVGQPCEYWPGEM